MQFSSPGFTIHRPRYFCFILKMSSALRSLCFFLVLGNCFFLYTPSANALTVSMQAPSWVKKCVSTGLAAVDRELKKAHMPSPAVDEALEIVGERLYPGYSVTSRNGKVTLSLKKKSEWKISCGLPESASRLSPEAADWLKSDIDLFVPEVDKAVRNVSPEALKWGTDAFRAYLKKTASVFLPGWRVSATMKNAGGSSLLKIRLYPEAPLLITVNPHVVTHTVPQLLADDLGRHVPEYFSPFIGLPVSWIRKHETELSRSLDGRMENERPLSTLRAVVVNSVKLSSVTEVVSNIESTTYSLRGWFSAHAGTEAQLQLGVHLGKMIDLPPGVKGEVYGETVFKVEDWGIEGRCGLRFSPLKYLWLGVEGSTSADAALWYRMWFDDRGDRGPYAALRYSENYDLQVALGYRLNRYMSFEMYYDKDAEDRISLRAVGNL